MAEKEKKKKKKKEEKKKVGKREEVQGRAPSLDLQRQSAAAGPGSISNLPGFPQSSHLPGYCRGCGAPTCMFMYVFLFGYLVINPTTHTRIPM